MVAQLVRVSACHAEGRGFEPRPFRQVLFQSSTAVVQQTVNLLVDGSIPSFGAKFYAPNVMAA